MQKQIPEWIGWAAFGVVVAFDILGLFWKRYQREEEKATERYWILLRQGSQTPKVYSFSRGMVKEAYAEQELKNELARDAGDQTRTMLQALAPLLPFNPLTPDGSYTFCFATSSPFGAELEEGKKVFQQSKPTDIDGWFDLYNCLIIVGDLSLAPVSVTS